MYLACVNGRKCVNRIGHLDRNYLEYVSSCLFDDKSAIGHEKFESYVHPELWFISVDAGEVFVDGIETLRQLHDFTKRQYRRTTAETRMGEVRHLSLSGGRLVVEKTLRDRVWHWVRHRCSAWLNVDMVCRLTIRRRVEWIGRDRHTVGCLLLVRKRPMNENTRSRSAVIYARNARPAKNHRCARREHLRLA